MLNFVIKYVYYPPRLILSLWQNETLSCIIHCPGDVRILNRETGEKKLLFTLRSFHTESDASSYAAMRLTETLEHYIF